MAVQCIIKFCVVFLVVFIVTSNAESGNVCEYFGVNDVTELLISRDVNVTFSSFYHPYATAEQQAHGVISSDSEYIWNSGLFAPQWIQLDLKNAKHRLYCFRLLTGQIPPGDTLHQVYAGSSADNITLVKEFRGYTNSFQWLTSTFNPPLENIRFIQIKSIISPSWISWRKIFIYGRKINDDQARCTVTKSSDQYKQCYTIKFDEDNLRN